MPGDREVIGDAYGDVCLRHRGFTRRMRALLLCAGCALSAIGCTSEKAWKGDVPNVDMQAFAMNVYPVLMRDCAFNDCHGGPHRFFQVFGPGRVRLDPTLDSQMPPTDQEIEVSYERARSMLITTGPVTQSLLLTKPLAIKAGGAGHRGVDAYGRNVYESKDAPGYQAILQWAESATAAVGGSGGIAGGSGGAHAGSGGVAAGSGGRPGAGVAGAGAGGSGSGGRPGSKGRGM
jgi:hypothetical protein